jgi:hypothetical protein
MSTAKPSHLKRTKSRDSIAPKPVRKTKKLVVEIPEFGLSPADVKKLKQAFRSAVVCSVGEVAGVLKPKQKSHTIALAFQNSEEESPEYAKVAKKKTPR